VSVYPHVKDVPDPVDLAMIVLPVEMTLTTLQECADRGIRNAVIITSGFKEVGRRWCGAGKSGAQLRTRTRYAYHWPQLCGGDEYENWNECHIY